MTSGPTDAQEEEREESKFVLPSKKDGTWSENRESPATISIYWILKWGSIFQHTYEFRHFLRKPVPGIPEPQQAVAEPSRALEIEDEEGTKSLIQEAGQTRPTSKTTKFSGASPPEAEESGRKDITSVSR